MISLVVGPVHLDGECPGIRIGMHNRCGTGRNDTSVSQDPGPVIDVPRNRGNIGEEDSERRSSGGQIRREIDDQYIIRRDRAQKNKGET
jgi:hypothetical protein